MRDILAKSLAVPADEKVCPREAHLVSAAFSSENVKKPEQSVREALNTSTVTIGFCDHPPSEGLRSLKPARPLYQGSLISKWYFLYIEYWL